MEQTLARSATLPPWTVPTILASLMLAISSLSWSLGGAAPAPLILPYLAGALASALIATTIFAMVEAARLKLLKVDRPTRVLIATLVAKLPLLIVPALVFPLFMVGYSAAKASIPDLVGFRYDVLFAQLDASLFGTDPWRITHALIGPIGSRVIEFLYVPVWITALAYSGVVIALVAERRLAMTFFTASLLVWLLGGFVLAFLLSSAGPIFTGLVGQEQRFGELRSGLAALNGADSAFLLGSAYLERGLASGQTLVGGGISAMPSMHVAVCVLYCQAAAGTRFLKPALAFLSVIVVGSVHSGYHYAVDTPVAIAVAMLCWKAASLIHGRNGSTFGPIANDPTTPVPA